MPFTEETARARLAQSAWAKRPVSERVRPAKALRHLLVERAKEIGGAASADIGRTPGEMVATDILPTASALKFLHQRAERILRPKRVGDRPMWLIGSRDTVHRSPHGIVGLIGTWNYPTFLNVVPIAHALVAGNAVLWKPSELVPRTSAIFGELFRQAGFPPEVLTELPATREAGPQLIEAEIDFLHFTGSDAVGRKLAARLGERLVPSTLELSGCDALVVLDDADITMAARSAWYGCILNKGQTCMATRRVFVPRSRYAEFVEALRPMVEAADPARLVTPGQLTHARKLAGETPSPLEGEGRPASGRGEGLLRSGTTPQGERVMQSNQPAPEGYFPPTAILDANPGMAIAREATFAPILGVFPYSDEAEMIAMANGSPFGLASAVFSGNLQRGEAVALQLKVGAAVVNDVIAPTAHPATPFGGRGASGWGVTQGEEGLLGMTVPMTVSVRKGTFRPHVDATLTNDPAADDVMEGMLRATHARTLGGRCRGLMQMLGGFRRFGKK
jgi:acyl-CoA reductase-like NAD-dependent aldehyde dehydrogenase